MGDFFKDLLKTVGGETEKVVFGASAAFSKVPILGSQFRTPIGPRERKFREKYGGSLYEPTPADSFTDGQDEDAAILDLITNTALPSLQAKISQQGVTPEDLLTMQNIWRLRTGNASNQAKQAFIQSTVGSNFFQRFAAGELDDPEAFAQAQDEWYKAVGPSLAQASAGMVQTDETGAPIDEEMAWFQTQQEQQAKMDQFKYQRESLLGLLDMLPPKARMQVLPLLLEDPNYRRMLFLEEPAPSSAELSPAAKFTQAFQGGG